MSRTYNAAADGDLYRLQSLIKEGENLAPRLDGRTPLFIAAEGGHIPVVDYLLSDQNPRKAEVIQFIDLRWNKTGATATYQAAQNNHLEVVQRLVESGASLAPRPDGCSPLWVAAQNGHAHVVNYLLSDQNPRKVEVIQFIDSGWNKTGATATYQAAKDGHLGVLQRLVENGASLAPCPDGCSPLWIASQNGHVDVVHYLLSDRNPRKTEVIESINSRWSKAGGAALNAAVSKNREEIVLSLLAAGASPNQPHKKKNNKQESALQCALQNQQYGIALALLAYDSNINPSSQELIIKYKTQLTDNLLDLASYETPATPRYRALIQRILNGQNSDPLCKAYRKKRRLFPTRKNRGELGKLSEAFLSYNFNSAASLEDREQKQTSGDTLSSAYAAAANQQILASTTITPTEPNAPVIESEPGANFENTEAELPLEGEPEEGTSQNQDDQKTQEMGSPIRNSAKCVSALFHDNQQNSNSARPDESALQDEKKQSEPIDHDALLNSIPRLSGQNDPNQESSDQEKVVERKNRVVCI
ncbi:ankyrin repeat domain-containing protein [Coxiella burnetii]|uniref:ankyrin repeat domain-containing protein n=1 Tax=Coxiella burnetii TaxID=777 RepID=UPI00051F1AD6|nr:ankyrin repeat domain-containing protein [Coxiella burnetii]AIT63578.1 Ankyrin repeat protein [Coxiella burnetii str. Namibia]